MEYKRHYFQSDLYILQFHPCGIQGLFVDVILVLVTVSGELPTSRYITLLLQLQKSH